MKGESGRAQAQNVIGLLKPPCLERAEKCRFEGHADAVAGSHSEPPQMWTEEYQAAILEAYLDLAATRPWIVGLHVWNFADFKTGQATHRPMGINHKGVFTRDRQPKMAARFLRSRWVGSR